MKAKRRDNKTRRFKSQDKIMGYGKTSRIWKPIERELSNSRKSWSKKMGNPEPNPAFLKTIKGLKNYV